MCRAIRVVVVAEDEGAARPIRIAVGPEAEIAAVVSDDVAAAALSADLEVDVVIADGTGFGQAAKLLAIVLAAHPRSGVVWVGPEPPEGVHAATTRQSLPDDLPSAVVRALIGRR